MPPLFNKTFGYVHRDIEFAGVIVGASIGSLIPKF